LDRFLAVEHGGEGMMSNTQGSVPSHVPTKGLYGWVTHTEISSSDPGATKEWCADVLGWTFKASFPTPTGEYHLFAYSDQGGGGIRSTDAGEQPGSIPFIHVEDAQAAFTKAIGAGAEEIQAAQRMAEGVTTALVRAPGGVLIGFSGP
jgi:uncharacterized protein